MSSIIVVKDFLSKLECSNVLDNSLKTLELIDAEMYGGSKLETIVDSDIRKSKISFTSDMGFVNDRLKEVLKEKVKINGFDTTNLYLFQFTEYDKGGHFDWHVDSTKEILSDRYYSCIILLNEDYEGGELEIKENYETITIQKNAGDLILFPSAYLHRVSPVLEGKRYTLVNWVIIDINKPKTKSLI